ncbi:MAG: hypothetical protein H0V27_00615 [Pyrinomonadaceae bacterium]|nr:hypothetical protein [Pyrinomonadaceae bacterium]
MKGLYHSKASRKHKKAVVSNVDFATPEARTGGADDSQIRQSKLSHRMMNNS